MRKCGRRKGNWQRKYVLDVVSCGELHLRFKQFAQTWREDEDRKNWVFPSLEGLAEGPRRDGVRLKNAFPGEGKGRLTHKELYVAMDA